MKCPHCDKPIRPEWKLCIYCGYELKRADDPRVERAGSRERGSSRTDRYGDDDGDDDGPDDEYGGRRGNGEPPSRGGRTSSRGRGRSSGRDDMPPDTDDSAIAPAFPPRGDRGSDRGAGYGRSGRGYDEDDDDREGDGARDERWSRSPRPSPRRPDDRGPRADRSERGSRPRNSQFDDPLDDPRAPGFLRGSPASRDVGRPGSSSRAGRDAGYDAPGGGRRPPSSPSRQGRQDFAGYPDEPRGYGASSRVPPRRTPQPRGPDPLADSWDMPAFASAEDNAAGWTDTSAAWGGAPGAGNSRNGRRPNARGDAGGGQRGKFIALGVFLAALLVGGGVLVAPKLLSKGGPSATTLPSSFATYTPGATPTPAANYTLFTSKRSAYILTYPQGWSANEQPASSGDDLDVFAGQGGLPMLRVEQATGFAGVSDQNVITGEVASAKNIDATATYAEDLTAATTEAIGGEQWMRREFNVSSAGVKYRMAILSCHHGGKGYVIVLVSAPADFATNNSGAFKTMLASFRFVG